MRLEAVGTFTLHVSRCTPLLEACIAAPPPMPAPLSVIASALPDMWYCVPHRLNSTALQAEKLQGILEARGPAFLETYKLPLLSWEEAEELKQSAVPALESHGNGAMCVLCSASRHQLFHCISIATLARPS